MRTNASAIEQAAALLASVVMDRTTGLGCFLRLLLDVEEDVSTSGNGQVRVTMELEEDGGRGVERFST